jgi:hypothetical protein
MAKQFVPFTIPCKPTSPHVKVELVNEDEEVIPFLNFTNTRGFLVENSDHENIGQQHMRAICLGKLQEKVADIHFILQIEDQRTLLNFSLTNL